MFCFGVFGNYVYSPKTIIHCYGIQLESCPGYIEIYSLDVIYNIAKVHKIAFMKTHFIYLYF